MFVKIYFDKINRDNKIKITNNIHCIKYGKLIIKYNLNLNLTNT